MQQWFRSVWREAHGCWMTWSITVIEFLFFPMRKLSPLIRSSTNEMIESQRLRMTSLNTAECQQSSIQPQSWWLASYHWKGKDASGLVWFVQGSRRSLRYHIKSSNKAERRHTWLRMCRIGCKLTWAFGPKNFGPHSYQTWTPSTSTCRQTLRKKIARHATPTQMSLRLLWTTHASRWRKASWGRSARASHLD